jgi:phage-related tail protein
MWLNGGMIDVRADDARTNGVGRVASQPIALAAVALVLMLTAAASVALWRATTGALPDTQRAISARQTQLRAIEASEQLVEKTKALEVSQQESIDQLQVLQDQAQVIKRLLAAQQSDVKRLSEQVGSVASAIDGLRQSFASAQSTADATDPPQARHAAARHKTRAMRGGQRKRSRSRS